MELSILNWIRGTAFPEEPAAVYAALFSSNPTGAGSGTEVTETVRAAGRVAVTFGEATTEGTAQQIANTVAVNFGENEAVTNVTVTHTGLYDAATEGNLLMYAALDNPRTFAPNDPIIFPISRMRYRVD